MDNAPVPVASTICTGVSWSNFWYSFRIKDVSVPPFVEKTALYISVSTVMKRASPTRAASSVVSCATRLCEGQPPRPMARRRTASMSLPVATCSAASESSENAAGSSAGATGWGGAISQSQRNMIIATRTVAITTLRSKSGSPCSYVKNGRVVFARSATAQKRPKRRRAKREVMRDVPIAWKIRRDDGKVLARLSANRHAPDAPVEYRPTARRDAESSWSMRWTYRKNGPVCPADEGARLRAITA